jgi:pimeloyl-ACP methyl ester carboxylesterase
MTTIKINGAELRAEIRGVYPRAVFVHGFGGDLHTWDSVWQALGQRLPAVRYDLRGFGQSRVCDDIPYNHTDDLLAVVDTLAIERCDVVGVSMGGAIALNFALNHPDRVRNLILISPALVAWEWSQAWLERSRAITIQARNGAMDEAKRLWWEHPLFRTTRTSAAGPALYDSIMRFSGAQWIRDLHVEALPDVERLYLLDTRTLLLTGGQDVDDFRLIADLIEGSAGNLTRIDDPERGHLLNLEDPQGCARKIVTFLESSA